MYTYTAIPRKKDTVFEFQLPRVNGGFTRTVIHEVEVGRETFHYPVQGI